MNNDPRGTISRQGVFMSVENALVEDVSTRNGRTGHLLISYADTTPNQITVIQTLRLNVSQNTTIFDANGQPANLNAIESGMFVNAVFSQMMTRSIPPQANAFLIFIRKQRQPGPSKPGRPGESNRPGESERPNRPNRPGESERPTPANTTTGRIVSVDLANNRFTIGNPSDINNPNSPTIFNLSPETTITNRNGASVGPNALRAGQTVRVIHANFQTASIPPQTTAFHVQIL